MLLGVVEEVGGRGRVYEKAGGGVMDGRGSAGKMSVRGGL